MPNQPTSLHTVATALREGRTTCVDVVNSCLAAIDACESDVHAWVLVDRVGALQRARELDAAKAAGQPLGLLHGIPIGIKDIIDIAGRPTSAGYPPWSNRIAKKDAAVVERLRDHGAIILGKTVTTMFAGFDPPVTRNPWQLDHTPGGSSSGSAAGTAAGMCLGAIGTQTGGSITRPASFCGVAACKPTFGRVPLDGIVPLSATMDHGGPMAATVRDVALLLEALVTPASKTPSTADRFMAAIGDATRGPVRLGRLRGFYETMAEPEMQAAIESAASDYASRGAMVVDVPLPPSFETILANHKRLIAGGAARVHGTLFTSARDTFLPKIGALLEEGLTVTDEELAELIAKQEIARRELLAAMDGLDAVLCPASRGPAPDTTSTGDPSFNAPWSYTGLPVVSFPIATSSAGLPMCVQMIGRPWEEVSLFRVAAWCENRT